jgi:hypothetical protein
VHKTDFSIQRCLDLLSEPGVTQPVFATWIGINGFDASVFGEPGWPD